MAGSVAGREDRFEMPASSSIGRCAEVDAFAVLKQPFDGHLPSEAARRQIVSENRSAVPRGTNRGGADVVGMMMRQQDAGQSPVCQGIVEGDEEALLLVRVGRAGVEEIGRLGANEEGVGVRAWRRRDWTRSAE
jgi:hypothetical protein